MKQLLTLSLLAASVAMTAMQGSTIVYTDRPSFLASGSNWTTQDFNLPGGAWDSNYTSAGLTLGDVNYLGVSVFQDVTLGTSYTTVIFDPGESSAQMLSGGVTVLSGPSARTGYLLITFADTNSFGFDYRYPFPAGFDVTLSNGYILTGSEPSRDFLRFVGFVADTPFNSVRVDYHDNAIWFDNVTYAADAPEPAASSLVLGGLAALATAAFRRNRRAS